MAQASVDSLPLSPPHPDFPPPSCVSARRGRFGHVCLLNGELILGVGERLKSLPSLVALVAQSTKRPSSRIVFVFLVLIVFFTLGFVSTWSGTTLFRPGICQRFFSLLFIFQEDNLSGRSSFRLNSHIQSIHAVFVAIFFVYFVLCQMVEASSQDNFLFKPCQFLGRHLPHGTYVAHILSLEQSDCFDIHAFVSTIDVDSPGPVPTIVDPRPWSLAGHHAEVKFIVVALARSLTERAQRLLLLVVVFCTKSIILASGQCL